MAYKFCENHLSELYEAIKNNNISAIKKVEHELSSEEECVACSYIFKAKGDSKKTLETFLAEEGFVNISTFKKPSFLIIYAFMFIAPIISITLILTYLIVNKLIHPTILVIVIPFAIGAAVLLYSKLFGK